MGHHVSASIFFGMAVLAMVSATVSGEWVLAQSSIFPCEPDHERATLFNAMFEYRNVTDNGAGNGTGNGQNGTGNQTANQTANRTANLTSVNMVVGGGPDGTGGTPANWTMVRAFGTDGFAVRLGPWAPGEEFLYHFEASLSNGTVICTNDSWFCTPEVFAFRWHDDFSEAAGMAASLGRPMLVLVYSDRDHTSEYMLPNKTEPWRSGPFCNEAAVALSPSFVCLRVDADADPALAARLGAASIPCLLFFNATSGRTIDKISGPFGNATLTGEMRYILGKGPRPSGPRPYVADIVAGTAALALTLTAGPALMLYYYLQKKRFEK